MVSEASYGFCDYAKFMAGFVLRPTSVGDILDTEPIFLDEVSRLRRWIKDSGDKAIDSGVDQFWKNFEAAILPAITSQFAPLLQKVSSDLGEEPFASLPFWPGTTFHCNVPGEARLICAEPHFVVESGMALRGDAVGFTNYAKCAINGLLAEMEAITQTPSEGLTTFGSPPDLSIQSKTWGEIWRVFMGPPPSSRH